MNLFQYEVDLNTSWSAKVDIPTDLPGMINHPMLRRISGLEASLPFSFSLPSTSLYYVSDKMNFKGLMMQPLQPQCFILCLCCCFHHFL